MDIEKEKENIEYITKDNESDEEEVERTPKTKPPKKQLSEKQIKNLENMRKKKAIKKEAIKMVSEGKIKIDKKDDNKEEYSKPQNIPKQEKQPTTPNNSLDDKIDAIYKYVNLKLEKKALKQKQTIVHNEYNNMIDDFRNNFFK